MSEILAKSAQIIQQVLEFKGLKCKVVEMPSSTRTAQDAASSIGCNVAQIVKSLIFKTKDTNEAVLILVSGSNRVKEKVVEEHLGQAIEKADADFIREVTGFAIGGIPPIGHKQKINHVFIDEDLLKWESLWAAAGTPHAVFNISSIDLIEISKGEIVSF